MSIEVRDLTKKFGSFTALDNISLEVEDGELLVLLGPSGCGKTTLLRIIAGLEEVQAGEVRLDGRDISRLTARERNVGFVFQHYALFRHMTVFDNVAFGLNVRPRSQRPPKAQITERVMELLSIIKLDWAANRYPAQLSGGQRQRVALARALAVQPEVLLLDEPFGALDARVRRELRRWLRHLHDDLKITTILVTHDQEEALEVADRVVVMNEGRIVQIGTPDEVYGSPADPFVFSFLGSVNLFHGRIRDGGRVEVGGAVVDAPNLSGPAERAVAYVRPHDIDIRRQPADDYPVAAVVREARAVGQFLRLWLETGPEEVIEAELSLEAGRPLALKSGEKVWLRLKNPRVFEGDGHWDPVL